MSDNQVYDPGEMDELKVLFREWDREIDAHYSKWEKETRENFDIVAGRSWTKHETTEMEEANRIPVEFNRVAPLLKAVVGAEIAGRLRVDYKPRTMGDAKTNELLTSAAEWVRDECDAEAEESQAFMNALICGMGWTETRLDDEEGDEVRIVEDLVDSLEMRADPSASKPCAMDARYVRRRRKFTKRSAKDKFGDLSFGGDDDQPAETVDDPRNAYNGDEGRSEKAKPDEVIVTEWQWYDIETVYEVMNPATGEAMEVSADDFLMLEKAAEETGRMFPSAKKKRRRYRRAFQTADRIFDVHELETDEFTYKCITGDYDRNEGVWFGLVRAMRDPQKWANKFFSQIIHILSTNAKGGVMMEEDAVPDMRKFEETWAAGDSATIFSRGALTNGKIQPKPMGQYPQGIDRLMDVSLTSIRDVAGINPEFMGQADRQQAGVLEHQRKQAAYGIMATYFDALRRFRRLQGRLLVKLMRYLPPGTLVRVTMDDWQNPQYLPLEQIALELETSRFDVIVDEAPTGPNQKERTFQILMQMLPMVGDMMTPELWLEVLEYSPLPTAFVEKVRQVVMQGAEDPEAEAQKQLGMAAAEADVAGKQAKAADTQASAQKKQVEAAIMAMMPDANPQVII